MFRFGLCLLLVLIAWTGRAAERHFDFERTKEGEFPIGFRNAVTGDGPVGIWQVLHVQMITNELAPRSSVVSSHAVLAQVSKDPTDERFPLLIYEAEKYGDFTMTSRFRILEGQVAQMAGIAFRIQDERNYYVLRASSLGKTVVFYKFVEGIRTPPITAQIDIQTGSWHELIAECRGNQIRCLLDGRELFPVLNDNSFVDGYVGFWTKSDSTSHFAGARVSYTPRENLASVLVREVMERYPRLEGVKIHAPSGPDRELRVIASNVPTDVGQPSSEVDRDVLQRAVTYHGKDKKIAEVALPLRDRNGEPVAVVRVLLRRFPGQTEGSAVGRARPIVDYLQTRIQNAKDLTD